MKKLLVLSAIFIASLSAASAQELGIRFGDVLGNDVAIDGIFSLGEFSRLHADVSFGNDVGIEVLYDFLYRPLGDVQGLDWYVGAGPSLYLGDPVWLGVSGEVGLEYHFDFPLALGLDWRPTFWIIDDTDFNGSSFGLNARYVFGK